VRTGITTAWTWSKDEEEDKDEKGGREKKERDSRLCEEKKSSLCAEGREEGELSEEKEERRWRSRESVSSQGMQVKMSHKAEEQSKVRGRNKVIGIRRQGVIIRI